MNISSTPVMKRERYCTMLREELPVLRAKAHITQAELSNAIGISRQTYCAIENGKRKIAWTVFLALIAFFQNEKSTKNMIDTIFCEQENSNDCYRE